jgi:hypothetical protein
MRATKAYIASLGTTGVLLGASILLLAVVSAVVAFDRWPSGDVSARVQTLVLADKPAPIRVSATASGSAATSIADGAAGTVAVPRAGGGGQIVGDERVSGRPGTPPATDQSPLSKVVPEVPADPLKDVRPATDPIIDTISNPATTAGQVADGAQSVTDAAGVSLGQVSPELGNAVIGTGQAAAQTVRQIPLPQHILPGH